MKKKLLLLLTALMLVCLGLSLFAACDGKKEGGDEVPRVDEDMGDENNKTEPTYTVIYADGTEDEEIEVPTDTNAYKAGDIVTVKDKIARTGYSFKGWADGETLYRAGSTFTMPARDVTLVAEWGDYNANPGMEDIQIEHHGRVIDARVYRPNAVRFPVVIFSHGYNGSKADFDSSAQYLMRNGIGAITFTFCGSGASDKSGFATTDMTLFTEKEDLSAVMDYAKSLRWFNGSLFLLGGSQGGMVSAMAAEERAADVKGMVLLFPGLCIPDDWNSRYPTDASVPDIIPWWGVNLGRDFVLSMRDLDIYAKMAEFTKPVLLMHGTNDDIVPISYSQRAANTYPNAQLITYTGEGHGFTPNTMRDVEEKLLAFITENT